MKESFNYWLAKTKEKGNKKKAERMAVFLFIGLNLSNNGGYSYGK